MARRGSKDEKELLDLEHSYWVAMADKDAERAAALMDESCMIVGSQGVLPIDASTMAKLTKDDTWKLEHFALDEESVQLRFLTDDVAIVAYRVDERLTVEGESLPLAANDSSVWVRRNGEWRCALHTESIVGDPFGRDRSA